MVWRTKFDLVLFFGFCCLEDFAAGFVCFERDERRQIADGGVFFRCAAANWIKRFAVVQAGPGKR